MAGDLNRLTIVGRLTRDPELKYIASGTAVANFSIANNKVYTTGGEKKEEVNYFDCIAWGKLGETIAEWCQKGKRIGVEGKLQQRRWEDQEGNKRSKIEIVVDTMQFLDSSNKKQEQDDDEGPQDDSPVGKAFNGKQVPNNENPFSDDNIPF